MLFSIFMFGFVPNGMIIKFSYTNKKIDIIIEILRF